MRTLSLIRASLALTIFLALVLLAVSPAHAQTETALHNFTGTIDGTDPWSGLAFDGKGNIYGTTVFGGLYGEGTVYELSPNGNGGWNETEIYSFAGGLQGWGPMNAPVTFDGVGNFYGTTCCGGAYGYGVVFELSPTGNSWNETTLYSFAGGLDGSSPNSGVIFDPAGNLYGTTFGDGNPSTVFELSPAGAEWTEQVIFTFPANDATYTGLALDANGNVFTVGFKEVVELSPNGSGGWTPTVIATFTGSRRGGTQAYGAPVLDKLGNLYGTTLEGGGTKTGSGTVYKLTHGSKGWKFTTLYRFKGGKKDGYGPQSGIVFDAIGNIYGTTDYGGTYDYGTVYELVAPVDKGGYKEKVLWSPNDTDGAYPTVPLIVDSAGNLYGTTNVGGTSKGSKNCGPRGQGCGVVFELTP